MVQLWELDKRITAFDERIDARLQIQCYLPTHCPDRWRGPKTATAIVAAVSIRMTSRMAVISPRGWGWFPGSIPAAIKNSSLGISKRGDRHLRTLLVHGARAVLRTAPTKHDKKHAWAQALQARRGSNRAIVAIANKMARVIWSLLASGQSYRKQYNKSN